MFLFAKSYFILEDPWIIWLASVLRKIPVNSNNGYERINVAKDEREGRGVRKKLAKSQSNEGKIQGKGSGQRNSAGK